MVLCILRDVFKWTWKKLLKGVSCETFWARMSYLAKYKDPPEDVYNIYIVTLHYSKWCLCCELNSWLIIVERKITNICFSVRITLLNDSSLVRAAGLRALRYMIKTEQHVVIMNKLQYPALIARWVNNFWLTKVIFNILITLFTLTKKYGAKTVRFKV